MNVIDDDYDREGLALMIADLLPDHEVEADRVLTLAKRIHPLLVASRAVPVDYYGSPKPDERSTD